MASEAATMYVDHEVSVSKSVAQTHVLAKRGTHDSRDEESKRPSLDALR